MGTQRSGLPWHEPTTQSRLPVCDAWRVHIYPVWDHKQGMKMYYENVLKEGNTALHFPYSKKKDGVQKLVASMPDDQALGEWDLHTLEDMRWNDNHQRPIKYCSQDINKSITGLMWQPSNAKQLNNTPHRYFNSITQPRCLFSEMHHGDSWWETQLRRDTPG